jgi:hypothetical protein
MAEVEDAALDKFGFFLKSNDINVTKGEDASPRDLRILRRRERKWRLMIEHWEEWTSRHTTKLKERCRKGSNATCIIDGS